MAHDLFSFPLFSFPAGARTRRVAAWRLLGAASSSLALLTGCGGGGSADPVDTLAPGASPAAIDATVASRPTGSPLPTRH